MHDPTVHAEYIYHNQEVFDLENHGMSTKSAGHISSTCLANTLRFTNRLRTEL